MNNDFIVTKDDIFIAQIAKYEYDDEFYLKVVELGEKEMFRKVLVKNGHVIDFKTKTEIYTLKMEDDIIVGDVYENTMYCINLIKPDIRRIPNRDLRYAAYLYDYFLERQKLFESGKVIPFPKRNLTRINKTLD